MKILCLLLGLGCPQLIPPFPLNTDYADVVVSVRCPGDKLKDDSPRLNEALRRASDLWWTTPPQSESAALSTEGARVAVDGGGSMCSLRSPMDFGPHPGSNIMVRNFVFWSDMGMNDLILQE